MRGLSKYESNKRKMQTLRLWASGKSYLEAATELNVSTNCVMKRLKSLREQWECDTTEDLCAKLNIPCGKHQPGRSAKLTDQDRRVLDLISQGFEKSVIEQRLGLQGRQYGTITRRIKKAYGIRSLKELRTA